MRHFFTFLTRVYKHVFRAKSYKLNGFLAFLSAIVLSIITQPVAAQSDSTTTGPKAGTAVTSNLGTNGATTTYFPQIIPASPNATALSKYADIPVNNYTGTPSIAIPLYTIKTRDLTVPINISYHGSGVRVEEEASSVGLGWALNAGGVIQHIVRGTDDFADFNADNKWRYLDAVAVKDGPAICYFYENENAAYFLANRLPPGDNLNATLQTLEPAINFERPDIERDVFSFNFLGQSGKFVIKPLGSGQYKIYQLSQSDLRIELIGNGGSTSWNSGFIITGTDGTKYYFDQQEWQRSRTGNPRAAGKTTAQNYDALTSNFNSPFVSAWYLKKIESQRGDVITFTYSTTANWISALLGRNETYATNVNGSPVNGADPAVFRWNITETQTQQVYPSSILFDNGTIQFIHASRQDLNSGAQRLDKMTISTVGGSLLKSFQFNQDYFSSGSTFPGHISKRLKLQSIQESNGSLSIPPYTFTYEESILLPDKDSYMQDYWGYFNGQSGNDSKGTMLPPFNITKTNGGTSVIYKLPVALQGGADRTANSVAMRAGVLTKITYPTGSITEFDFQAHTFSNLTTTGRPYFIAGDYTGGVLQTGGGLRINKITVKDRNVTSQATTYSYSQPGTNWDPANTTGKLMYNLQYADFVPTGGGSMEMVFSSSPRHPMGSGAQGNPIGYNWVTVYKGATPNEQGYSSYQYQNSIDTRAVNFCIEHATGTIDDLKTCIPQPNAVTFNYFCDPYSSGLINNYSGITDPSIPNYVNNLNGSLLREEHYRGGTGSRLLKLVVNEYEATNRSRLKNFRVLKRNGEVSCLIYYTDSEWIRLKSSIVSEYSTEVGASDVMSTTTTYGYSPDALHRQVTSITTDNSRGEFYETLTNYPQDNPSGSSILVDLNSRNIVVPIQQTRNKINSDQSRFATHVTRTNYAKWFNLFVAPQNIETKIGSGPYVQDIAYSYSQGDANSSLGDILSVTERNGITTNFQYYISSGKKYLPLNSTIGAGTSLASTTTYDYDPLKGLNQMTSPANLSTYYVYDGLGRLMVIKNSKLKTVKEYKYNYRDASASQGTGGNNQVPTTSGTIADQLATLNQTYTYMVPVSLFADPEGQTLTFTLTGLPAGLSYTNNVISGTPSASGQSLVTLTATDPSGLSNSISFFLTVSTCLVADPYIVTGTFSSSTPVSFNAVNNIETDATQAVLVNPNASLTLKAGQSVRLKPGFVIKPGAAFRAYTGPCY